MEGIKDSNQANVYDYEHLIIKRKVVSLIVAGLITLCLIVFLAGFFWGYRRASHDVQLDINKTSFADQISYAALQLEPSATTVDVNATYDSKNAQDSGDNIINPALVSMVDMVDQAPVINYESQLEDLNHTKLSGGYYAELIGFGKLQAAQLFVDKLKNKGYQVSLRKRISKSGNGKTINWYQVITQTYSDKPALQKMLEVIKKTERLQGIKIKNI